MAVLTIGIAVYNVGSEFLCACLDSVVKNKNDNVEIIIVDDCSTDCSAQICAEYAKQDSRIRIITNKENMGVSASRNRMIDEANGEWILFLDGDDMLSEDTAEIVQKDIDCAYDVLIYDWVLCFNEKSAGRNITTPQPMELNRETLRQLSIACLTNSPMPDGFSGISSGLHSKVCRTDFIRRNNIRFVEGLKKAEDSLFFANVYFYAGKALYEYKTFVYYYRRNIMSVTKRYNPNFRAITDRYIQEIYNAKQRLYPGREDVDELYFRYRVTAAVIDNMQLVIFHKDNCDKMQMRRRMFLELCDTEPYKTALDRDDVKHYANYERRLALLLAKKRRFFSLNFAYKHNLVFRIYGFTQNKLRILKDKIKRVSK